MMIMLVFITAQPVQASELFSASNRLNYSSHKKETSMKPLEMFQNNLLSYNKTFSEDILLASRIPIFNTHNIYNILCL